MPRENDGFQLLRVDGDGVFWLGNTRLWKLTLGEVGAVFDVRLPKTLATQETMLMRVQRRSSVEPHKSGNQEILTCSPVNHGSSPASQTLAMTYGRFDYEWHLRLNADLTTEHVASEESLRLAKSRQARLSAVRSDILTELARIADEDSLLRTRFDLRADEVKEG